MVSRRERHFEAKIAQLHQLRRVLRAAGRWLANRVFMPFAPKPISSSRRALLRGQLWKLLPTAQYAPLVARLPSPIAGEPVTTPSCRDASVPKRQDALRNISGINIQPVPPTDFARQPSAGRIPLHRPPGAVHEAQFLAGCTRCGECGTACPHSAIRPAPDRLGHLVGTPLIAADTSACMMCEDYPCIAACEAGVLVSSIPPLMGTARVVEHLCLAYHHTTCSVCSERCPVEGAIKVVDGKPRVQDACTGCGVCRYVCPAPENAILLMPAFSRPRLPRRN